MKKDPKKFKQELMNLKSLSKNFTNISNLTILVSRKLMRNQPTLYKREFKSKQHTPTKLTKPMETGHFMRASFQRQSYESVAKSDFKPQDHNASKNPINEEFVKKDHLNEPCVHAPNVRLTNYKVRILLEYLMSGILTIFRTILWIEM